jgi:cytidylate kinase
MEYVETAPPVETSTFLGELEDERVRLPDGAIVVIDGPSGGGKSLLGQKLSKRYGLPVVEGGTLNRLATVIAFEQGTDLTDPGACAEIARGLEFELAPQADGSQRIIHRGRDVTEACRTPEVSETCPVFSVHEESHEILVGKFARMAQGGNLIAIGRITGRWLHPEAPVKAFVTGKVGVRATRRGQSVESVHKRDMTDGRRPHMPMRRAKDAKVFLNNEQTSFRELFCRVAAHFEAGYGLEPTPLVRANLSSR